MQPAITDYWEFSRKQLIKNLNSPLHVSGDGRCDSAGHNAKFCSYTIMSVEDGQIIDSKLIQVKNITESLNKTYISD